MWGKRRAGVGDLGVNAAAGLRLAGLHWESPRNPVESTLMGTRLSRAFLCMGFLMANEADTCRIFVIRKLRAAGLALVLPLRRRCR